MMVEEKFSFKEVFEYISKGEYPIGADDNYRRSLRRKAKNFVVNTERLYYIGNQEGKKKPENERNEQPALRLVVESKEERRRIIQTIHEDGHLGKCVLRIIASELSKYELSMQLLLYCRNY